MSHHLVGAPSKVVTKRRHHCNDWLETILSAGLPWECYHLCNSPTLRSVCSGEVCNLTQLSLFGPPHSASLNGPGFMIIPVYSSCYLQTWLTFLPQTPTGGCDSGWGQCCADVHWAAFLILIRQHGGWWWDCPLWTGEVLPTRVPNTQTSGLTSGRVQSRVLTVVHGAAIHV